MLHVIGGMVVNALLLGPGAKMWKTEPGAVHQPGRELGPLLALRRPGLDLPVPDPVSAVGGIHDDDHAAASADRRPRSDIDRHVKVYIIGVRRADGADLITVAISYLHLSTPMAIAVALFVATIKGSLVAATSCT